jgi:hypothetical protein
MGDQSPLHRLEDEFISVGYRTISAPENRRARMRRDIVSRYELVFVYPFINVYIIGGYIQHIVTLQMHTLELHPDEQPDDRFSQLSHQERTVHTL